MSHSSHSAREQLRQNLERVLEQVEQARVAAARPPDSIRLIGVSKYVDAALTWQLVEAGCSELGESRPQSIWQKHQSFVDSEAMDRHADSPPLSQVHWHMIGHLQRNKVARTLPLIEWLHSLDSVRLAEAINVEALKQSKRLKCLLEVNATEDLTKTGLPPEQAGQVLEHVLTLPGIEVRGLMSMSTEGAAADQARREFESVRALRDRLQSRLGSACQLDELSMGMSGDFPQAIAAGATMIRVGSSLWSGLDSP